MATTNERLFYFRRETIKGIRKVCDMPVWAGCVFSTNRYTPCFQISFSGFELVRGELKDVFEITRRTVLDDSKELEKQTNDLLDEVVSLVQSSIPIHHEIISVFQKCEHDGSNVYIHQITFKVRAM